MKRNIGKKRRGFLNLLSLVFIILLLAVGIRESKGGLLSRILGFRSHDVRKLTPSRISEKRVKKSRPLVPDEWQYQILHGRDCWLAVWYQPQNWIRAGIENEPFLKESLFRVSPLLLRNKSFSSYKEILESGNPIITRGKVADIKSLKQDFGSRYIATWGPIGEWTGWDYMGLCKGSREEKLKRISDEQGLPIPKDKKQAHELLARLLRSRVASYMPEYNIHCVNATFQDHLACSLDEFAFNSIEVGTCYNWCTPMQVIFARGAARQYQKPWVYYIANWGQDSRIPCGSLFPWRRAHFRHGPQRRPALSLEKRILYLGYMGGANIIQHEDDMGSMVRVNTFIAAYDYRDIDKLDPLSVLLRDRRYYLSPTGAFWKELYDKVDKRRDRGVPYTPVALLFDQYHGYVFNSYGVGFGRCLGVVPFTDADLVGRAIINTLYPWEEDKNAQTKKMTASPLAGDIFDVLTNTASLEVLKSYPVVFICGNVDIDKEFAQRLIQYVKEGGTLFINIAQQIKHFPEEFLGCEMYEKFLCLNDYSSRNLLNDAIIEENHMFTFQKTKPTTAKPTIVSSDGNYPLVLENHYGKGKIILTIPDYLYVKGSKNRMLKLFSYLIKEIEKEHLPFSLKGDLEYMVNRTGDSWVVTLLNNRVYQKSGRHETTKPEDIREVTIRFKDKVKVKGTATEWLSDKKIIRKNSFFKCIVPPGEVKILEFKER